MTGPSGARRAGDSRSSRFKFLQRALHLRRAGLARMSQIISEAYTAPESRPRIRAFIVANAGRSATKE